MKEQYLIHIPKKDHLTGILHQRNNLFALLMEAKLLNRTAVIPALLLNGKHNNGKKVETSWSRYIDINQLKSFHSFVLESDLDKMDSLQSKVIDENVKPSEIENEEAPLIIRKHQQYPNYYLLINIIGKQDWYRELLSLFRPSKHVLEYANIAINKMGTYNCMHVRRGDKLTWKQCPGLDKATQPKKLKSYLDKNTNKNDNIYIMSNETKEGYFDLLKEHYKVFTYKDFEEYPKLGEDDNYFLFMVESEIMNQAKIKIKTFKEEGYISILNYGPNGKDFLSNKIRRKFKYLRKKLNL